MTSFSKLNFEDTQVAFADKSDAELKRMYFLFLTMNNPGLTQLGVKLTLWALKLRLPLQWLIRRTLFAQFCGGESLATSMKTVERLGHAHIKTILDYSVEGEKSDTSFDRNRDEIIRSLTLAETSDHIPTGVMKLTGFVAFELLEKKQSGAAFSPSEQSQYAAFLTRVEQICARAVAVGKYLFVDAEEAAIQQAIDDVVEVMMEKFNQRRVYIFNTYQMYCVNALGRLKSAHFKAQQQGYQLGVKLVRGAYLEKERALAYQLNYPDPIHADKAACDHDYNAATKYCIAHIDDLCLCVGTHNEYSCHLTTVYMHQQGISRADPRVYFAQLYGMSDHLSYNLAKQGYNVAKYVPYGPVDKVVPYLMRRAEENTAMAGQSSRELSLIKKEISSRRKK